MAASDGVPEADTSATAAASSAPGTPRRARYWPACERSAPSSSTAEERTA